ncbi:hypothetical protein BH20PSE1_BH20PSE1_20880 [soil metagenome]|jgi:hypothetical protein
MTPATVEAHYESYPYVVSKRVIRDVERLLDVTATSSAVSMVGLTPQMRTQSILELEGLGKDVWAGIDARQYIDDLRDEWDAR